MRREKKQKEIDTKEMPFLAHLEELRWCILKSVLSVFIAMIAAFPFTGIMLTVLTLPNNHLAEPAKLIFLKPTGMLVVRIEIAIAVGVIVSIPVIFYQLWKFLMPGLHAHERRYFLPALLFTTVCFLAGAVFSYFVIIPTVLPFLFGMGTDTIEATINITEYMSFVIRLILVAGLVFELPVLSLFLTRIGILSPSFLKRYRRYGIVLIFLVSAILTPPDPMSQILMAAPLLLLYEVSIWISVIVQRKKIEEEEDEDCKEETGG
ncbi:twin-arginine translocase subunit TatC [bacterium]|nr:twin-arginine translocase subunit TatC [bacterium]